MAWPFSVYTQAPNLSEKNLESIKWEKVVNDQTSTHL